MTFSPAPAVFDNSYASLPDRFYSRVAPTPVASPRLVALNAPLAEALGFDARSLATEEGVQALAGNRPLEGASPIAQAYAGHQFGNWVPQLGDGRAVLLGEVVGKDGARRDIQLKGSGPTPYSRMGDGRAPLGPVIREYVVSEAMHALGVPTTRALAAVATGEPVMREGVFPGGVLTRVAASHIRVGTFQFFGAREDVEALRLLTGHALARHYPSATAETPALALLQSVMAAQARLVAKWMGLGFIHGVMNTDNTSIAGETIDYGPCAFMDVYRADTKFSSIDQMGRYAYYMQPKIAHWNLAQLAVALFPLLAEAEETAMEIAKGALDEWPDLFEAAWTAEMGRKLGVDDGAKDLATRLLTMMEASRADFTLTFRALAGAAAGEDAALRGQIGDSAEAAAWTADWRGALGDGAAAKLSAANPAIIPRNHLVEAAIAAAYADDLEPFRALAAALATPFDAAQDGGPFAAPPAPEEVVRATFCGT